MKSPWPLSRLNQGVGKGSRNDFVLMKTILYKYALDSCEIALRQALFQKLIGNPAQCRYFIDYCGISTERVGERVEVAVYGFLPLLN